MASTMENLAAMFSDVKTRTVFVLTGIILFATVGVGVLGWIRSSSQSKDSSAASIPQAPGLKSAPGVHQTTPEVAKEQQKLNIQRYQQASRTGTSTIPVDVGKTKSGLDSGASGFFFDRQKRQQANADQLLKGAQKIAKQTADISPQDLAALQRKLQELERRSKQQQQQEQQRTEQSERQAQQQLIQSMENQAQAAMSAWGGSKKGSPAQEYQERAIPKADTSKSTTDDVADEQQQSKGPPIIKAGDVMFAVLNTAVNSDEPGPILATIVSGKYKGAKLVGSLDQPKKVPGLRPSAVILNFNTLSIAEHDNSTVVNAVAIDPETARTSLASHVDSHYAQRYGTLFASSFLQGYGNAITQAGSITFDNSNGTQTQILQDLSPQEEIFAGLGQVGQTWGKEMGDVFNRPNTITVDPGISLGILFLSDVTLQN